MLDFTTLQVDFLQNALDPPEKSSIIAVSVASLVFALAGKVFDIHSSIGRQCTCCKKFVQFVNDAFEPHTVRSFGGT